MPPHCDTLDGPVVNAARDALASGEVDRVLPYVHADGEAEIRAAFDQAVAVRSQSPGASVCSATSWPPRWSTDSTT